MIPAEKLLFPNGPADEPSTQAVVKAVDYQGQLVHYFIRVADTELQAINGITGRPFQTGETVNLRLASNECGALPTKVP